MRLPIYTYCQAWERAPQGSPLCMYTLYSWCNYASPLLYSCTIILLARQSSAVCHVCAFIIWAAYSAVAYKNLSDKYIKIIIVVFKRLILLVTVQSGGCNGALLIELRPAVQAVVSQANPSTDCFRSHAREGGGRELTEIDAKVVSLACETT